MTALILDLLLERKVLALQSVQPIDARVQHTFVAVHLDVAHQFGLLERNALAQRLHCTASRQIVVVVVVVVGRRRWRLVAVDRVLSGGR